MFGCGAQPFAKAECDFRARNRSASLFVGTFCGATGAEGCALIQTAKYLPPDNQDSTETIERELEELLDLVQPGWRDVTVHRRFLPDMIVMNAMPLARTALEEARSRSG